MTQIGDREAREIIAALRTGAVPRDGLHHFATGLDSLVAAIETELDEVAMGTGSGRAKWLRGEYGSGKTFATRLICHRARQRGFATAEVQVSVTDTPMHRLEMVYRRLMERLTTATDGEGAFSAIVDTWIYEVGEEVMRLQGIAESDPAFPAAVEQRLENKLADLSKRNPAFARVLRAYHQAMEASDFAAAQGLLAWLSGEPSVAAAIKRSADVKGDLDGPAALTFLRGVLQLLRESKYKGLVLVLDEVETIQRMRSDVREKALNALRQLIDLLLGGDLPGLYLVVTGTPEFYDGYKGLKGLAPLAARVQTRFGDDPRFDNLRAPQVRLAPFNAARLTEVGRRIRDLYPTENAERIATRVDDRFLDLLVEQSTAAFGGQVAIVPRLFLRELVDVLDRVDQYDAFDPAKEFAFEVDEAALAPEELAARRGASSNASQERSSAESAEPSDAPRPKRLD